jgi:hypothetical protein
MLSAAASKPYLRTHMIFEGEDDHKIPAHDMILLNQNIFYATGLLMAHSFVHTGVAFFGLSPVIVQYLCTENLTEDTIYEVSVEDLSSIEVREAIRMVSIFQ